MIKIKNLFDKPKVIGIVADVNQGKSNTAHYLIRELDDLGSFSLFYFGFNRKPDVKNAQEFHTVKELETIRNSIIFLDELMTLFNLDDRNQKRLIENTLRLIHHNNNILVLMSLPENMKKFLAGKVNVVIFKQCTFADFINGSRIKHIATDYRGRERGSSVLNLDIDKALVFDGAHYETINVDYIKSKDSKADNKPIITLNIKRK